MRAPLEWLYQYCAPELSAAKVAERLAMTGTDVERVERFGVTALDRFVVGRVLETQAHPGADRLSVCTVDVGDGSPSQIVCGAPNVRRGQLVAVAKPGAERVRRPCPVIFARAALERPRPGRSATSSLDSAHAKQFARTATRLRRNLVAAFRPTFAHCRVCS